MIVTIMMMIMIMVYGYDHDYGGDDDVVDDDANDHGCELSLFHQAPHVQVYNSDQDDDDVDDEVGDDDVDAVKDDDVDNARDHHFLEDRHMLKLKFSRWRQLSRSLKNNRIAHIVIIMIFSTIQQMVPTERVCHLESFAPKILPCLEIFSTSNE